MPYVYSTVILNFCHLHFNTIKLDISHFSFKNSYLTHCFVFFPNCHSHNQFRFNCMLQDASLIADNILFFFFPPVEVRACFPGTVLKFPLNPRIYVQITSLHFNNITFLDSVLLLRNLQIDCTALWFSVLQI